MAHRLPRRCAHAAFAVLALICLMSVSTVSGAYLSPSGTPVWDGNCDFGCLDANAPCGLPSSIISINSSIHACEINFAAGNYLIPASINEAETATNISVSFATDNGGVTGIELYINASIVVMSGTVSSGTINVSMEATDRVLINGLTSFATTFNFASETTPSIATAINVTSSTFTVDPHQRPTSGLDAIYIFLILTHLYLLDWIQWCGASKNFNILGNPYARGAKLPSFGIDTSTMELSQSTHGMMFSEGGCGPRTISIERSQITSPFALVTFNATTQTKLLISHSTVTSAGHIFKSLHGIDASSFNSYTDPLRVYMVGSTVTGRSDGLSPIYDPNACVDVGITRSSVSFLDINCNSPYSSDASYRCFYDDIANSTLTDNRFCMFGSASSLTDFTNVSIVVSTPTRSPIMTWIRSFLLLRAFNTSFDIVPQIASGHSSSGQLETPSFHLESTPYLFSEKVEFEMYSTVRFTNFTLDTGATLRLTGTTFENSFVKMGHESSIMPTGFSVSYTFNGHADFSMFEPGTATVRADMFWWAKIYINVDEWSLIHSAPVVQCNTNVTFIAPMALLDGRFTWINWNSTRLGGRDPTVYAYPLFSNAMVADVQANTYYAVNSTGGFDFTAWLQPDDTFEACRLSSVCGNVFFGNARYFPAGDPTPSVPSLGPSTGAPGSRGNAQTLAIALGVSLGVLAVIAVGVVIGVCVKRCGATKDSERMEGLLSETDPLLNASREV